MRGASKATYGAREGKPKTNHNGSGLKIAEYPGKEAVQRSQLSSVSPGLVCGSERGGS